MNKKTYQMLGCFAFQFLIVIGLLLFVGWVDFAGKSYVLKGQGYDPYDPLRGHYISLTIEDKELPLKGEEKKEGKLYAVLGDEGLTYCSFKKPEKENYIQVEHWYKKDTGEMQCYFGQQSYYVNEKEASSLEEKIRDAEGVQLQLHIKKGCYKIEGLLIDGVQY